MNHRATRPKSMSYSAIQSRHWRALQAGAPCPVTACPICKRLLTSMQAADAQPAPAKAPAARGKRMHEPSARMHAESAVPEPTPPPDPAPAAPPPPPKDPQAASMHAQVPALHEHEPRLVLLGLLLLCIAAAVAGVWMGHDTVHATMPDLSDLATWARPAGATAAGLAFALFAQMAWRAGGLYRIAAVLFAGIVLGGVVAEVWLGGLQTEGAKQRHLEALYSEPEPPACTTVIHAAVVRTAVDPQSLMGYSQGKTQQILDEAKGDAATAQAQANRDAQAAQAKADGACKAWRNARGERIELAQNPPKGESELWQLMAALCTLAGAGSAPLGAMLLRRRP